MLITGIIYKYTSPSGKVYIGQTLNEKIRRQFFFNLNCSYGGCKIDNTRHKYKPENFTYEILYKGRYNNEIIAKRILNELEVFFIRKFNSFNQGYNCTLGGESLSGFTHTPSTREKMRKSQLGKPKSKEHIENIRKSLSSITFVRNEVFLKAVRKPVAQYTKSNQVVREFISITEATKITGINGSNIGECCYGRRKTAGGYIWKFID